MESLTCQPQSVAPPREKQRPTLRRLKQSRGQTAAQKERSAETAETSNHAKMSRRQKIAHHEYERLPGRRLYLVETPLVTTGNRKPSGIDGVCREFVRRVDDNGRVW